MAEDNTAKRASARGNAKAVASLSKEDSRSKILGREPPHNSDAEQGVLASIMLDSTGEVINACLALKVREDYFYTPAHRKIFGAAIAAYNEGKAVDMVVIAEYLSKRGQLELVGGMDAISEISGRIETYAHFHQWLDIVREKYFLRTIIDTCIHTVQDAYESKGSLDSFMGDVEQKMLAISQDRVGDSVKKASEKVDAAVALFNKLVSNRGRITGVATGFNDIDSWMRGLHENEMIVIAGRPGTGKTSIALNIVENAIFPKDGEPTPSLIFSLEMLTDQLYLRMISSRARVDQKKIGDGFVTKDAIAQIQSAAKELKGSPLWIDDTANITVLEMRAKARRLNQQMLAQSGGKQKLGLIVVDYLQLLKGSDPSMPREQQVSEISRGMKAMAKELLVPVIVLAQLNRESEKGDTFRPPRPSDLRESGAIEQDADAIILLSRIRKSTNDDDSISSSTWQIRTELAKNRNGPTGVTTLNFDRNHTRYYNFTPREDASA